jgi:hypothetical protein
MVSSRDTLVSLEPSTVERHVLDSIERLQAGRAEPSSKGHQVGP